MKYRTFQNKVLFSFLLHYVPSASQTICRDNKRLTPHGEGLWTDIPSKASARALCEGKITKNDDIEICFEGRLTYAQVAEMTGLPIARPGSETISINGHLTGGVGNARLGTKIGYIYDYVRSYTINGSVFQASPDMVNNLLAASKGLIDGVCLDKSITKPPSEGYRLMFKNMLISQFDKNIEKWKDADIVYIGAGTVTAEFHTPISAEEVRRSDALWFKAMILFSRTPLPVSLQWTTFFLGILRTSFLNNKTFLVEEFSSPQSTPNTPVENMSFELDQETFLRLVKDKGFLTDAPYNLEIILRQIPGIQDSNNKVDRKTSYMVIDFITVQGHGAFLDKYFYENVFPLIRDEKYVLHFGKRIPRDSSGSSIEFLNGCLNFYKDNGIKLDVNIPLALEDCYHPFCARDATTGPTIFVYPSKYFANIALSMNSVRKEVE